MHLDLQIKRKLNTKRESLGRVLDTFSFFVKYLYVYLTGNLRFAAATASMEYCKPCVLFVVGSVICGVQLIKYQVYYIWRVGC